MIAMFQIGYISSVITGHLKEQLDDWRSSLMPDFRLPHLAVATVILASAVLGSSLSLYEPLAIKAASLLAGTMTLSAVFAWLIYDPLLILICSAIIGTGMAFSLKLDVAAFTINFFNTFPMSIMTASIVLIGLLWTCLSQLKGKGVYRPSPTGPVKPTMGPVTNSANQFLRWISSAIGDRMMNRRSAVHPLMGSWARIVHRRRANNEGLSPCWAGALSSLSVIAIVLVIKFFTPQDRGQDASQEGAYILGVAPLWVPLMLAVLLWPRRWHYLAKESLLPSSRRAFVYETGIALGIDLSLLWLSSMFVALLGLYIIFPHQFATAVPNIAAAVAMSAAIEPFIFGLTVWAMPFRNTWLSFGTLILLMWGSTILVLWQAQNDATIIRLVFSASATVIGAVILSIDAYRRMVRAELG
jgi:hypothetical protein